MLQTSEYNEIFGEPTEEKTSLYPFIKVNRGDDSGKNYGFELSYDQWSNIITSPEIQWIDAPHPGNKTGGTDKAHMLRQLTIMPIAKMVTWQYTVEIGEGDAKAYFNTPRHIYCNFADPAVSVAGVTKMLCLSREIPNVPFVLQTRGMVSKSVNNIFDKNGLFYQIIEKPLIVLSKRQLSINDLVVPLKIAAKKEIVNGGWFRNSQLNLTDEQVEQLKAIATFDEFKKSPFAPMLLATAEEKDAVESLRQAGEEWVESEKQNMIKAIKTNVYANFFFGCTKNPLLLQSTNLLTSLRSNEYDPVSTITKLTNELEHESNVKRLTA